ncbi:methionyl-tRNA formyltransferase [Actinomycetota bacterium]
MTRALFMGTPAAAVPALSALAGVADIVAVITQPDAAKGRAGHKLAPPVKEAAGEWGISILQPDSAAALSEVVAVTEFDIGVVVAYGRLLRPQVLAMCPFGFLNVHFSLLPRWRGAAPVERSIIAGDETTGVTVMHLDEGLDTGPVIAGREVDIYPEDTGGSLTARLAHIGADLLIDSLADYISGRRVPAPQMSGLATLAPRLSTAEARIHAALPVDDAERMIRGFNPRPGAWMIVDGERIKVLAAADSAAPVGPGALEFREDRPIVGFQGGSLELVSLQPAGHKLMSGVAWGNGRRHAAGSLESP